ncbi:Cytosolic sulfotransferase 15 [Carex littledalei]|uniref:Sulfotransferase n=1 Tax=Carex littledalei TaxID=544730 RepID=A0A833RQ20_9POAL|nr:Cytosolic sulfotransferase 15 [Carex littledalei]
MANISENAQDQSYNCQEKPNFLAKYELMACTIPRHKGLGFTPYCKYQNFWYPEHLLPVSLAMQDTFESRPSDVILATMAKSGTTWLKAIVFSIVNRYRYATALNNHPLLNSSPHDCFPFLHSIYEKNSQNNLESMPSPRLLAEHLPFSHLPTSIIDSGCKIVYLCRNPKDAFVSLRHYLDKMMPIGCEMTPFDESFDLFCEGVFPFGPFWDHMLEYWKESIKSPQKVLFLKYEDLKEDLVGNIERLGEFLGCPFSVDEVKRGVIEEIVKLCNIETMKNVKINKEGEHGKFVSFKNSAFFRKGGIGDWKEHITPDMAKRIDMIIEQKLHGSGLTF